MWSTWHILDNFTSPWLKAWSSSYLIYSNVFSIIHGFMFSCSFTSITFLLITQPLYSPKCGSCRINIHLILNLILWLFMINHFSGQLHGWLDSRALFLFLTQSKLKLCSANHRAGYFSNLACDWLSIVWAYSEQETENGPRSTGNGPSLCSESDPWAWLRQDLSLK